jgi:hypothetical protein
MIAAAFVMLTGCDLHQRAAESTTTIATLPGAAQVLTQTPTSDNPRPTTTRPAENPCRDYDGEGFVGSVSVEATATRILATEGTVMLLDGAVGTRAPDCEVIGPPLGIDALIDDEWVEQEIEPGPVQMGPGGPVPISGAVHPIWLPHCDARATYAERLRLRLVGDVTLVIEPVAPSERDVEFVVGCDGELSTVGVSRVMTFVGYG